MLISISEAGMPKPRGTAGATKMKIMAIICYNWECGIESYGYNIWQALKSNFHMYINDGECRNVYHHLKDLCEMGMLERENVQGGGSNRFIYRPTPKGLSLRERFAPYLEVVRQNNSS